MAAPTDRPPVGTPHTGHPRGSAVTTTADRVRQVGVTAAYLFCLAGSMIGVGVFGGTPIAEAAGGVLTADATPLAPASEAFSVWTPIYLGLAAYTLWQWSPRRGGDARQRRVGWWVALSMVLNAAWILVVQAGWIWLSVGVIVALLATLARIFVALVRTRPTGTTEAIVLDGTIGLYLGWVCVATCANIASALVAAEFGGLGAPPAVWAGGVLVAVAAVGVALAVYGRGRLAVAATLVWGLAWIAVSRTTGELVSVPTAVVAAAAAVVVAGVTLLVRWRASRAVGA